MRPHWLNPLLLAAILLLAGTADAAAQGERYVGVRKDKTDEIILFAIDTLTGTERKLATLQKAGANIQLLGITTHNARRGTFSYAYSDRDAGRDFLHTVSVVSGQTVSRIALPPDISGLEAVTDAVPVRELQSERDVIMRKIEALEQEIRRLQSQVRPR